MRDVDFSWEVEVVYRLCVVVRGGFGWVGTWVGYSLGRYISVLVNDGLVLGRASLFRIGVCFWDYFGKVFFSFRVLRVDV